MHLTATSSDGAMIRPRAIPCTTSRRTPELIGAAGVEDAIADVEAGRAGGFRFVIGVDHGGRTFPWQSGSDGQEETEELNLNRDRYRGCPRLRL
jgi:hypothetical protein